MIGGCLCGAVTLVAEDVETDVEACHCGPWQQTAVSPATMQLPEKPCTVRHATRFSNS